MPVDIDLDADLFSALGHFASATSPCSPWPQKAAPPSDDQVRRLVAAGILDDDRNATPGFAPVLMSLASADAVTRVEYYGGGTLLEYADYLAHGRSEIALSVSRASGVRIQDPAPKDQQVEGIGELVGHSSERGIEFEATISLPEAFVFAALIDGQRHRALSDLVGTQGDAEDSHDLPSLTHAMMHKREGLFWLVNCIARVSGAEPSVSAPAVTEALQGLSAKGLVESNASKVALVGPGHELAERLLIVGALIELENRCAVRSGAVARVGFTGVQAGVREILTIESLERGIHLETVSGATLVSYIERFVRTTDSLAHSPLARATFAPTHLVAPGGVAPRWAQPNTSSKPVAGVPSGTGVRLLTETGGWAQVESSDGERGWLDRRWINDL